VEFSSTGLEVNSRRSIFIVLLCWLSPVMLVFSCNVAVGFTCMLVRFVGLNNKVLEIFIFVKNNEIFAETL